MGNCHFTARGHSKWLDQLWEDPDPHSIPNVHSQSHTWSQSPLLPWQFLKLLRAELKPKLLNSAPRPQPPDPFWFHVLVPGAIISVILSPLISIPPVLHCTLPSEPASPLSTAPPQALEPFWRESHRLAPCGHGLRPLGSLNHARQSLLMFPVIPSLFVPQQQSCIITSLEILPTPSSSTGNLNALLENETTSQPHLTSIHNYSFSSSSLAGWGPYSVLWIPSTTAPHPVPTAAEPSISVPAPSGISEVSPRHIKMLNTLPFLKNGIYWKWQTSIEYV